MRGSFISFTPARPCTNTKYILSSLATGLYLILSLSQSHCERLEPIQ